MTNVEINGNTMASEITADLPGGATMEMVLIEPGEFEMGSQNGLAKSDERPQHRVQISKASYLARYELTQGQYESVMKERPWDGKMCVWNSPRNPAVYISWWDVQKLISRLNRKEGRKIYRLPMEAEWEYAARVGTSMAWSFGNDESLLEKYAWYRENCCRVEEVYAHEVGTKLANAWELHDMHGNVWEWVSDWYGAYRNRSWKDPRGPKRGSDRVIRGGDFFNDPQYTRSISRGHASPEVRYSFIGCRLLMEIR